MSSVTKFTQSAKRQILQKKKKKKKHNCVSAEYEKKKKKKKNGVEEGWERVKTALLRNMIM